MALRHLGASEFAIGGGIAPPGLDLNAVSTWLERRIGGLTPPLCFAQIIGGRSNLTFMMEDARGCRWVLRRPPLGGVLATAHDMAREARILSALRASPIPVPSVVATCLDETVTGAPFYVMNLVAGTVLRTRAVAERALDPAQRRNAGLALVDLLASLHAVKPCDVGLDDLGREDGYIERQLRRWRTQVGETRSTILPLIDEVHRKLATAIPRARSGAIVHGDYRLDNCIVSETGTIEAVLDWELCTLGDPLADLGMLLVYWSEPGDTITMLDDAPTTAPGFPTRREVLDRYASASGGRLSSLDFYTSFAYWKLACIVDGVANRLRAGTMGESDVSASVYAEKAMWLAEEAAQVLHRSSN